MLRRPRGREGIGEAGDELDEIGLAPGSGLLKNGAEIALHGRPAEAEHGGDGGNPAYLDDRQKHADLAGAQAVELGKSGEGRGHVEARLVDEDRRGNVVEGGRLAPHARGEGEDVGEEVLLSRAAQRDSDAARSDIGVAVGGRAETCRSVASAWPSTAASRPLTARRTRPVSHGAAARACWRERSGRRCRPELSTRQGRPGFGSRRTLRACADRAAVRSRRRARHAAREASCDGAKLHRRRLALVPEDSKKAIVVVERSSSAEITSTKPFGLTHSLKNLVLANSS